MAGSLIDKIAETRIMSTEDSERAADIERKRKNAAKGKKPKKPLKNPFYSFVTFIDNLINGRGNSNYSDTRR